MAKFSLNYVKQNPVMFGVIFVVFGVGLWLMLNRGAGGGGGSTQVVQSGPSEGLQAAALSAGTALQMKQIEAQTASQMGAMQLEALSRQIEGQAGIATLELQYRTLELAANERLGELQTTASLAALNAQLNATVEMQADNNSFALNYARAANDAAVTTVAINAALQRELGAQQLDAYKHGIDASIKQTVLSVIPTLKKKNRDEALAALGSGAMGVPNTYIPQRGGGFGLGDVLNVVSPIAGAIA